MEMCRGRQKAFLSLAKAPETQSALRLLGKAIGLEQQHMVVPSAHGVRSMGTVRASCYLPS